jgi:Fe-S cluster assembly scaffold protein SufB
MDGARGWTDFTSDKDEKAILFASLKEQIKWLEHQNRSLKEKVQLELALQESLQTAYDEVNAELKETRSEMAIHEAASRAKEDTMAKTIKNLLEEVERLTMDLRGEKLDHEATSEFLDIKLKELALVMEQNKNKDSALTTVVKAEPAPVVKAEPAPVVKDEPAPVVKAESAPVVKAKKTLSFFKPKAMDQLMSDFGPHNDL